MPNINQLKAFLDSYSEIKNEKMPISLAYKLNQIANSADNDLQFYSKNYNKYLSEYAEKDSEGQYLLNEDKTGIILKPDTIEEAHERFNELDNYNFPDLKNEEKISISEFNNIEISPTVLAGIMPFLKNEE